MNKRHRVLSTSAQCGFTIIESVLAAAFFFIVALIICQMFTIQTQVFLLNEEQRSAEAQVEQLINRLAAQQRDTLADGEDRVIVPAPGNAVSASLPFGCAQWPCHIDGEETPLPAGTAVLFVRRWTINAIDAQRNLVSVTVRVFENPQLAEPLVQRTTNIVPQ